jgi:hypothetical protein
MSESQLRRELIMRAYSNYHIELQESILLAFQYFETHLGVKRNSLWGL